MAASHHVTNSEVGLYNKRVNSVDDYVTVGEGTRIKVKYFGDLMVEFVDGDERKCMVLKKCWIPPRILREVVQYNDEVSGWMELGERWVGIDSDERK